MHLLRVKKSGSIFILARTLFSNTYYDYKNIHKYIKDEIKSEVSKQSSLLSLSSHVEGLKVKGDLRLRYQSEDNSKSKRDKEDL